MRRDSGRQVKGYTCIVTRRPLIPLFLFSTQVCRTFGFTMPLTLSRLNIDCEGLRGSAVPSAAHIIEEEFYSSPPRQRHDRHIPQDNPSLRGPIDEHRDTAVRAIPLQWADSLLLQSDRTKKKVVHPKSRQIIVQELYPRLLYTFSDVVCFVTTNPR